MHIEIIAIPFLWSKLIWIILIIFGNYFERINFGSATLIIWRLFVKFILILNILVWHLADNEIGVACLLELKLREVHLIWWFILTSFLVCIHFSIIYDAIFYYSINLILITIIWITKLFDRFLTVHMREFTLTLSWLVNLTDSSAIITINLRVV